MVLLASALNVIHRFPTNRSAWERSTLPLRTALMTFFISFATTLDNRLTHELTSVIRAIFRLCPTYLVTHQSPVFFEKYTSTRLSSGKTNIVMNSQSEGILPTSTAYLSIRMWNLPTSIYILLFLSVFILDSLLIVKI